MHYPEQCAHYEDDDDTGGTGDADHGRDLQLCGPERVFGADGRARPKSSAANVTVTSGTVAPTISSVSPNPVTGSTSAQTITINGANFVNKPTVFVTWTGGSSTLSSTQVTFVSSTQLQMSINVQNDPDNWTVRVTNPNGQVSNTFGFTVVASTVSTDAATFVSETILDGTMVTAGQPFTKSWTIRNSGTTTWNSNYRLRWVSGANLSNHADVVIAGTVAPGSLYTFIVPMTAPTSAGTYREDWKFINPSATTIRISNSNTIWVSMKVADSSTLDRADFISETYVDGTTVPAGQPFTKSWTIRNSGSSTWNSNYRLRWVSGSNLSSHADVQVNGTIPPGANYTFNVPMTALNASGTYREDWKFINPSGVTIPVSASSTVWVSVRVNVGGQSSITGSVTSSAGGPIGGAEVRLGSNVTQSNSQGAYSISGIAAGDYTVTVSKAGFTTFNGPLSLPANTQAHKDFTLQTSVATTGITILSVTSKYGARSYFLDGVGQNVTLTANVDWGSHPPGTVSFITPKGRYDVVTNSTTASKTLDMGSEFGACGKLRLGARSTDGTIAPEKLASFVIMAKPPLYSALQFIDSGDDFNYNDTSLNFEISSLTRKIPGSSIPKTIPFFGGSDIGFDFKVAPTFSITRDGRASYALGLGLDRSANRITKGRIAGFDFEVDGRLGVVGNYSDTACKWNWGGTVGFHTDVFRSLGKWRIPQTGYIVYLEGGVGVRGDADLDVLEIAPWTLNGQASVEPYARVTGGGGLDMILAAEVFGELAGKFDLLPQLGLTLKGAVGYRIVSHWFGGLEREHKLINCSYSFTNGGDCDYLGLLARTDESAQLILSPRDYLKPTGYATFNRATSEDKRESLFSIDATNIAAIQSIVFPLSDPSISSNGNNLYLTWLYDDPNRSSINRSVAVFSTWDGSAWSEPRAIANDGTADSHPPGSYFSRRGRIGCLGGQQFGHA
jgi:hypothetical protein